MKLNYKENHLSIEPFESVTIGDFTVLTGPNGSGKTHLLEAIKNGKIEIEGINQSEIVYYNYNDFTVFTGELNDKDFQNKTNLWTRERKQFNAIIEKYKQAVNSELQQEKTPGDKIIFNYIVSPSFNFDSWLGNTNDYVLFNKLKSEYEDKNKVLLSMKTPSFGFNHNFLNFVTSYLTQGQEEMEEINLENLKKKFESALNEYETKFEEMNSDVFNFLKVGVGNIGSVGQSDFESPNFSLQIIANEEKEYELKKAINFLRKSEVEEWKDDVQYLEKDEFVKEHGVSPVEQINEVLNEYDCNGYFLKASKFENPVGVDKQQMKVDVYLMHKDRNYATTFDKLSSGEQTLMALSFLISKSRKKKVIPRVLLLDEIDSSLHPSMIQRLLNVIIEVFIKKHNLKVIMVTHSPTTVALSPDESIYIVNHTGVEKISKKEKNTAINILSEGFVALNNENSNLSVSYSISQRNLPILFTEGITDKIIIETAWVKLYGDEEMPFYVQDCFDASFLANLFRRGDDAQDGIFVNYSDKILMALFDFDYEGYNAWNGLKKAWEHNLIEADPIKCLTIKKDNGFSLLLPVPDNESIKKQVINGAGTHENDSKLDIELMFYGVTSVDSYFVDKTVLGGGTIVCFQGDKRTFALKTSDLGRDDFKSFIALFDKINELIS